MRESRLPRVRASELVGRGWLNTGGRDVTLADLRGKIVILDFWTFCCINCLHVLDELRELEEQHRDVLVIVGVHSPKFVHEADPVALAAAVERYEVHHPVLDDPNLVTWSAYTARAWPTLVVIDPEGYVVAQMAGEGHRRNVEILVRELVAEHEAKGTLHRGDGPYVPPAPTEGTLRFPAKAIALPDGHLLVADAGHHSLAELEADGETLVRRIGSGERGLVDGGPDEARFSEPNGLCLVPDELRAVARVRRARRRHRQPRAARGPARRRRRHHRGRHRRAVHGRRGGQRPGVEPRDEADEARVDARSASRRRRRGPRQPARPLRPSSASSPPRGTSPGRSRSAAFVVAMAGNHTLWAFDDKQGSIELLGGTMNEGLLDGPLREAWFAQPSGLAVAADDTHLAGRRRDVGAALGGPRGADRAHRRRRGAVRLRPPRRPGRRGPAPAPARRRGPARRLGRRRRHLQRRGPPLRRR